MPQMNLRLAQILASWEARRGHLGEAQRTLAGLIEDAPEMAIALPGMTAASMTPSVPRAVDGIAETYLALAATLRQLSDTADPRTRTFEARYVLQGALADAPLGATVTIEIPDARVALQGGMRPCSTTSRMVPAQAAASA